jgi:hypothetical protein
LPRALTLLLVVIAALAGLGAGAYRLSAYLRPAPNNGLRQVSVGTTIFSLRGAYLRPSSSSGERLDELDLAAFFPGFAPAGDAGDVRVQTDLGERFQRIVFISIRPSDSGLDPAERLTRLYPRFLDTDQWTHPGGLVARAFQKGSPFENEELYFAAPEGRAFAARCQQPDQTRKTPNTCAYDFRLGDLDVELRFSAALLSDWEALNAGARGLIESARR